jgi:hypothetical protein
VHIEELLEGKHMKTGERQNVVDRALERGLPRIRCKKAKHFETSFVDVILGKQM